MAFDYEQLRRDVSWDVAKRELGYTDGEPLNLARLCIDRHVGQGRGDKVALIHENHEGDIRQFTYRDLPATHERPGRISSAATSSSSRWTASVSSSIGSRNSTSGSWAS